MQVPWLSETSDDHRLLKQHLWGHIVPECFYTPRDRRGYTYNRPIERGRVDPAILEIVDNDLLDRSHFEVPGHLVPSQFALGDRILEFRDVDDRVNVISQPEEDVSPIPMKDVYRFNAEVRLDRFQLFKPREFAEIRKTSPTTFDIYLASKRHRSRMARRHGVAYTAIFEVEYINGEYRLVRVRGERHHPDSKRKVKLSNVDVYPEVVVFNNDIMEQDAMVLRLYLPVVFVAFSPATTWEQGRAGSLNRGLLVEPDDMDTYIVESEPENVESNEADVQPPTEPDPDAPWTLRLNPLFSIFGWELWWEYEYVSGRLIKSETHWRRLSDPPQ